MVAGLKPRGFTWVITDRLAVSERVGGSGFQHRRVRREEEITWLVEEAGINVVVSMLPGNQNLLAYREAGIATYSVPIGPDLNAKEVDEFFRTLSKATGRNTGNLDSASAPIVTFIGVHVVGAYRIATTGPDTRLVKTIEPALRIDYTDPNTDVDDDQGILVTPVINVYFGNTVVLRAGLDFYSYTDAAGDGHTAREFKVSWQANF